MVAALACPEPSQARTGYVAGEVLAHKYRLERPLGEGGQAAVWRATNLALDAAVAVKLVNANSNEEQTLRLVDEARVIARLCHPAIVRVFDVDRTTEGHPFVVMELLEGETLRDLLERDKSVEAHEAVRLLLPIADALAAAHAQGIVHRDVKPENIFLCESADGVRSKLLDFGTVKLPNAQSSRHITADGYVVGTPGYLAPEQALGHDDLDHRADVWGLCVTLYELLTGRRPFEGASIQAVLRAAVIDEVTPVDQFAPCDPRLWRIIARGLAKHPEDRWPSIDELSLALARWLASEGVRDDISGVLLERRWLATSLEGPSEPASSRPVIVQKARRAHGPRNAKRLGLMAAGIAVALASAGAWGFVERSRAEESTQRAQVSRSVRTAWESASAAIASPLAASGAPSPPEKPRIEIASSTAAGSDQMPDRPAAPRSAVAPRRSDHAVAAGTARSAGLPAATSGQSSRSSSARRDEASDLIDPY
jgi:serine/threonine protein kinase